MLKTIFFKYKWAAYLVAFLLYTFGVWHVTNTYNKASILEDKLTETNAVLKNVQDNNELGKTISGKLQKDLQKYLAGGKTITKEIQREIITNNIYNDCKSTDGVVRNYRQKLESQDKPAE